MNLPEIYPGRSVIVLEMLDAWKARNDATRSKRHHAQRSEAWYRADSSEANRTAALESLRYVWHALRAIR